MFLSQKMRIDVVASVLLLVCVCDGCRETNKSRGYGLLTVGIVHAALNTIIVIGVAVGKVSVDPVEHGHRSVFHVALIFQVRNSLSSDGTEC